MGAAAEVASTVRHRLKTIAVREDLIGWVQAGTKTLRTARGAMTWRRGDVFLLRRGTQWDVENDPAPDGHYRALVLLPGHDLLRLFDGGAAAPVEASAKLGSDAELADAMLRSARALDPTAPLSAALQQHRLHEVLMLLAERGWRFDAGLDLTWAERARQHIGQRPEADWTVEALAAGFHVSESTLRRRLAADGTTAGELVREVRLETALGLLQCSALPVGEIAARCGYESHSRFSAAFRARFGIAPSELRPVTVPAQRMALAG